MMSLRRYEAVMKAVADPTRVRILKMLEPGELCVCQIIAVLALSPSTISKHLFLLKSAGLVNDRKEKKWIHYSLDRGSDDPYVAGILHELSSWLRRDPVIVRDRARLAEARKDVGPSAVCAALPCVEAML
jgi:ArsR family transcriptional regulator, arsenate/arsenite/antimonite-responsive transcriptional repressor